MLSWSAQLLLVRLVVLLPGIDISLRLLGARRTQAILARWIPSRPIHDGLTPETINWCVRLVASRGIYRVTCLRRSLALWWLLERRGVASVINIGTAHAASGFQAHAWVEWVGGGRSDALESLKHLSVLGSFGTTSGSQR
jgi:hypothetical protein